MSRVLSWFSCGAASAVAAKMAVEKYGARSEVVYCDTLAYEHPDNRRFLTDVERWLGAEIKILRSAEYADIFDVFRKTGWLVGPKGARCTTELKKNVRVEYSEPDDVHVFGFTADERARAENFRTTNFDLRVDLLLVDQGIDKQACMRALEGAGIVLPEMYRLGYRNNNCIGCVKGGMGYWNKIRRDFPEAFQRMAALEREMGVTILKDRAGGEKRQIFLDELEPWRGRYESEPETECGVLCPAQGNLFEVAA